MKHLFIPYELALKLKEKGFDCGNSKTAYTKDGNNKISPYSSFYDPYKYPILDCTHSLAIKWIRLNFNKIITVYANASGYCFEIHDSPELGGSHVYDSDITGPNESGCWDNFEDANEAALLYTLKHLIK